MTGRTLALAMVLLCGCARNAFLELEIELPKNDRAAAIGERFANIRVATADTPFEQEWHGDNPIPAVRLSDTQLTSQRISVEATEDGETKPVRVKVRFCKNATCTDRTDDLAPEAWLEIERAFYIGKRTSHRFRIVCLPNAKDVTPEPPKCEVPHKAKSVVSKCLVGGCRSGVTSNYCVNNKHFCEE